MHTCSGLWFNELSVSYGLNLRASKGHKKVHRFTAEYVSCPLQRALPLLLRHNDEIKANWFSYFRQIFVRANPALILTPYWVIEELFRTGQRIKRHFLCLWNFSTYVQSLGWEIYSNSYHFFCHFFPWEIDPI